MKLFVSTNYNSALFFLPALQIFSMVVFASIINEGYVNMGSERLHCVFNKNPDACNYGITIGIVAFIASVLLLALDVYFPQISSVKDRKRAVLLEVVFSGKAHTSIYTVASIVLVRIIATLGKYEQRRKINLHC